VLDSDLSELIGYHLLGLEDGYVDLNDDELWEKLQINDRIQRAVITIHGWSWRPGEEWFADALCPIV